MFEPFFCLISYFNLNSIYEFTRHEINTYFRAYKHVVYVVKEKNKNDLVLT